MAGSQSWTQAGKEEHARGEGEHKAAQAKGYAEGVADRMGGYKDSVVGAVSGDKSQQAAGKRGGQCLFSPMTDDGGRQCEEREGPGSAGSQQALRLDTMQGTGRL